MKTKICSICKLEQSTENFNRGTSKDGLYCYCKSCHIKYQLKHKDRICKQRKLYRQYNKKKLQKQKQFYYQKNKEKVLQKTKIYAQEHKEMQNRSKNKWLLNNPGKRKIVSQKYSRNHKKERNEQRRIRRNKDIHYKILCNLRSRLNKSIRNHLKSSSTLNIIGCSIEQLKQHLESQFVKGMSWKNYGYRGWHIDHIRPCASFDLSKPEEQKKCFHYSNLQPLWAEENMRKSSKYKRSKYDRNYIKN